MTLQDNPDTLHSMHRSECQDRDDTSQLMHDTWRLRSNRRLILMRLSDICSQSCLQMIQ